MDQTETFKLPKKSTLDWILGLSTDKLMVTENGRLDFPSDIPVCHCGCWLRNSCLWFKLSSRLTGNQEIVYNEDCYYHVSGAIEAEKNPDEWTEKQYNDNLEYIVATYL